MKIAMIAAVASNNTIGYENRLPWHIPEDFRYFKSTTLGKPIIMGRKTFESLKEPLPGRTNIVITRNKNKEYHSDVKVVNNLEDAIFVAEHISEVSKHNEVMVIGGEKIYGLALNRTNRIYMTKIHRDYKGDTFFPILNLDEWQVTFREDHDVVGDKPAYSFLVLDRVKLSLQLSI